MLKIIENISFKIGIKKHIFYFSIIFANMLLNLPYDILGKERSVEFILNFIKPYSYLWLFLGILFLFLYTLTNKIYSLKIYFHTMVLNTLLLVFCFSNFFISFFSYEYILNSFVDTIYFFLPLSILSCLYYFVFNEYINLLVNKLKKK